MALTESSEAATGAALAERAREAWAPFRHGGVPGVGLNGLRRHSPSGWTYGALVAHVTAWHDVTVDRFGVFARTGEMPPAPDDVDAFNAEAAAQAERTRPAGLLRRLDGSFERLVSALEPFTATQVAANDRWVEAVLAANTWEHYDDHREELRSARPTSVAALLARYDADWAFMRAAVGRLGDERRLGEPADDGWRLRDVVAHMSGWLLEAVRVLPDYVAGRPHRYTPEGIDRQNAEVVAARRERSETAVIAELDAAGRTLRDSLARLRDEDVANRRTLGIVAACSYLHWDEHLAILGADV